MTSSIRCILAAVAIVAAIPASAEEKAGAQPGDPDRRARHPEVYQYGMAALIEATLTKSKDLARKGKDTYFCEYRPGAAARACDHMQTVSGQYEDYYRSQMACTDRCPGANISQNSWNYMTGTGRICRDPATGSCEKAALTVEQMRDELLDLLELEEEMRHGGRPRGAGSAPQPAPEQR